MPDRGSPNVFSIPVNRNFADALVNGLMAQFGRDRMTLARGMILVPNNRAIRAITDAFIRCAEPGLLLPRLVAVGDVGDEAMGVALDPVSGDPLPAAVDPLVRRFILARLVQQARAEMRAPVDAGEALRLASELATTLDTLQAEEVDPAKLRELDVANDLSIHWQKSLDLISLLLDRWPDELARMGRIDPVQRRNILLRRQADAWKVDPPAGFVVAAGITTSASAVAYLLRSISQMLHGMVVLPGVDIDCAEAEWDAIVARSQESHPQHHLRLLLDRMDVARSDVKIWRWSDGRSSRTERAKAVSTAFVPARFTDKWNNMDAKLRRLPGVRLAEFATPAEEAQGIAIALREALETPAKTAALITPDRALAGRVVEHLKRWGINADDSGGRSLATTPIGTLILSVIAVAVERFAPVPLLSLLKHPLVKSGEARLDWLAGVRLFDLAIRGPRPAPGLEGLAAYLAGGAERERSKRAGGEVWWVDVRENFLALDLAFSDFRPSMLSLIDAVRKTVEGLAGDAAWAGAAGRAASKLFEALNRAACEGPRDFVPASLQPIFRQLLGEIAVRPPQGGHPRISIWGLLEARLQSADLLVCGGLNEGVWPATATPDPWLAPSVRTALGLGGLDRRVGLAAHDLATALGGHEVLLTRAKRDARSPTISSRFLLRLEAMLGGIDSDTRIVALASAIDSRHGKAQPAKQPKPSPPAALRPTVISVTDVDRLKADPFAFYARRMLALSSLDPVDADPGPAWRGTMVHAIFDTWFKVDKLDRTKLIGRVNALFDDAAMHPVVRALWKPRLMAAMDWIADQVDTDREQGRIVIASEISGSIDFAGVRLKGVADRIDRGANGLAVVDYKTGKAPTAESVAAGYSLQLGLLGFIASRRGFEGVSGTPVDFEYWSLSKDKGNFGKRIRLKLDDVIGEATAQFADAAGKWLTGDEPFTAKLHPEYAPYGDYDHLMRLDEWYGRGD